MSIQEIEPGRGSLGGGGGGEGYLSNMSLTFSLYLFLSSSVILSTFSSYVAFSSASRSLVCVDKDETTGKEIHNLLQKQLREMGSIR